jgi:two-component system response regulator GlrR
MAREAYVLVVDDDPLIQNMVVMRLETAGYNVTTAGDAWAGVVQANSLKIGLVITDIQMPGVGNGVDGYKQLRQMSPNMPVIFMSGMNPADAMKILPTQDPRVRFCPKPIDFKAMQQAIKELTGVDRQL